MKSLPAQNVNPGDTKHQTERGIQSCSNYYFYISCSYFATSTKFSRNYYFISQQLQSLFKFCNLDQITPGILFQICNLSMRISYHRHVFLDFSYHIMAPACLLSEISGSLFNSTEIRLGGAGFSTTSSFLGAVFISLVSTQQTQASLDGQFCWSVENQHYLSLW